MEPTNAIQQARVVFNNYLKTGNIDFSQVDKVVEPVKKPVVRAKRKVVKTIRYTSGRKPQVIKQTHAQAENEQLFWSSLPSTQEPLVLQTMNLLGMNRQVIDVPRAEKIKQIIELGSKEIGTTDPTKIMKWIHDQVRKFHIAVNSDRPESSLLTLLKMR
jgi:hypothetical protein